MWLEGPDKGWLIRDQTKDAFRHDGIKPAFQFPGIPTGNPVRIGKKDQFFTSVNAVSVIALGKKAPDSPTRSAADIQQGFTCRQICPQ